MRIPKALAKTKGHLKAYLKASSLLFKFTHPIPHCETLNHIAKSFITLRRLSFHRSSLHWTPHYQPFKEATYTSHLISDMARIKGGHTNPSLSREPRLKASSPQDSTFQVPEAPTVPSSEGGVPFNPPQHRYETRRPLTSPPPESSVRHTPTKRVRTSGPGESSRHAQSDPRAPTDP